MNQRQNEGPESSSAGTDVERKKTDEKGGKGGNRLEGEGSYTATRRYNQNLARHQREQNVEQLAEEAREAVEGDEAEELKRAENEAKRGPQTKH